MFFSRSFKNTTKPWPPPSKPLLPNRPLQPMAAGAALLQCPPWRHKPKRRNEKTGEAVAKKRSLNQDLRQDPHYHTDWCPVKEVQHHLDLLHNDHFHHHQDRY